MIATEPLETRIQKLIIVYVDGRCRPEGDGVPVPPGGDGCEGGTFYMDSPLGGTARDGDEPARSDGLHRRTYRTRGTSAAKVTN